MDHSLRIAFIAKYAPPLGSTNPVPAARENIVYSKYHYDVYSILSRYFPNMITGTDATCILENHNHIDYIFSLLNRSPYRNSEVFISALAEYFGIPYLGSRPNIRALAEDKHLAKTMAEHCEIATAQWITVNVGEHLQSSPPFPGPYFVKPRFGASSKFIDEASICQTWDDATKRIAYLHTNCEDAIIEEFITGIFYSSPIITYNGTPVVLPPVREESTLKGNVVTYGQKRKVDAGLTRTIETDPNIVTEIANASQTIAQFIRPFDYTRIDYMISNSGLKFLEFNICCNLGIQSAFVLSAQAAGMSHEELIISILRESLSRQNVL